VKGRPAPQNDMEAAIWDRQHVMSLKLSMILSVARRLSLHVDGAEMAEAQDLVQRILPDTMFISNLVHESPGGFNFNRVRSTVRAAVSIARHLLLKRLSPKGIHADEVDKYLMQLKQQGEVEFGTNTNLGRTYTWTGA